MKIPRDDEIPRDFSPINANAATISSLQWKFNGCFKEALRLFQGCFKEVSRVFQGSLKGGLRVFQGSLKGVSQKFEGCFTEV